MIVCPACEHRNRVDAQVCEACGESLEHFAYRACPSCDALNPAENTFCHRCFSQLFPLEEVVSAPGEDIPVTPFAPQTPAAQEARALEEPAGLEAPAVAGVGVPPLAAVDEPQVLVEAEIVEEGTLLEEIVREIPEAAAGVEFAPEAEGLAEEPLEVSAGPLGELGQLLGIEATVDLPYQAMPAEPRRPSDAEQREGELFGRVAREPAPLQDTPQIVIPPRAELVSRSGRVLLCLLALWAALVPLFDRGQTSLLVHSRGPVAALHSTIQGLPADSAVLISFDYGPTYAAEMNPLALAVLGHLSARSIRTVAMCTKPGGIGSVEYVYRTVSKEVPAYRYGESYAILGYLPGQEAGLRTVGAGLGEAFKRDHVERRPLSELPVMEGLTRPQDFGHILVLADDAQAVRRWIEQVHSRSEVTLHALVTARVEPMLTPYRQSGQLRSLIGGSPDAAAEYEAISGVRLSGLGPTGAYTAAFLVLVLVAIATNIAYISGRRRRARSEG